MKKSIIFLIIGIVCAMLAFLAVKTYLDKERQVISEKAKEEVKAFQENQASVLVAKADIPQGTVISGDYLEVAVMPREYVQPNASSALGQIDGMTTLVAIAKGEQITINKLTTVRKQPQAAAGPRGLSGATPAGKRAVTLNVDSLSTSVGLIKAGDFVDIYALLSLPRSGSEEKSAEANKPSVVSLFQNVLVLAVGKDFGQQAQQQQGEQKDTSESPYVTVALSPKDANLLLFTQEQGKLRIVLRSPRDSQQEPIEPANWDTLLRYIKPSDKLQQPAEVELKNKAKPKGDFVEIYRGADIEQMPLSK